jgi:UDP-N-acetylglucosamine acyltransferase
VTAAVETVIHPTALISPDAQIGDGVRIGAYAIIGEQCVVGDGCVLAPRATLERNVTLAPNVRIGIGSVIGGDPQDLKFGGEETFVEIGEGTVVREYATINRGTAQSLRTTVGRNCLVMSYVHLAHDCHVGDHVIISNGSQFAGHVTVEHHANISGLCVVHQFTTIGQFSFIGGGSRVPQNVPPFVMAVGSPIKLYGLNKVGLQRNGFPPDTVQELKRTYRLLFMSGLTMSKAIERAAAELAPLPEVQTLLDFMRAGGRGASF